MSQDQEITFVGGPYNGVVRSLWVEDLAKLSCIEIWPEPGYQELRKYTLPDENGESHFIQ